MYLNKKLMKSENESCWAYEKMDYFEVMKYFYFCGVGSVFVFGKEVKLPNTLKINGSKYLSKDYPELALFLRTKQNEKYIELEPYPTLSGDHNTFFYIKYKN